MKAYIWVLPSGSTRTNIQHPHINILYTFNYVIPDTSVVKASISGTNSVLFKPRFWKGLQQINFAHETYPLSTKPWIIGHIFQSIKICKVTIVCCQQEDGIFNRNYSSMCVVRLTSFPVKVCDVLCCCTKIPVPVSQTCRVVSFASSSHKLARRISCCNISFDDFMFLLCVDSDQLQVRSRMKALTFLLELSLAYFCCGHIVKVTGLVVVGQLKWRTTRWKPLQHVYTCKLLWILIGHLLNHHQVALNIQQRCWPGKFKVTSQLQVMHPWLTSRLNIQC